MKKSDFISSHLLDPDKDIISQLYTDFGISCSIEYDELTVNRYSLGTRFIINDGYILVGEPISNLEDFDKAMVLKVFDECDDLYIEVTIDKDNLILRYEVPFNDKGCYRTELLSESYKITELPKFSDLLFLEYLEDIDDFEFIYLNKVIDDKFDELYNLKCNNLRYY